MTETDPGDVTETSQFITDEEDEEIYNPNSEDSDRIIVLQEKRKKSIGIIVTRPSVNHNINRVSRPSFKKRRRHTWPNLGQSQLSPNLNMDFLGVAKGSPTPSLMSIADNERDMDHVKMKENSCIQLKLRICL
eukprot:GFUD01089628.1.p1 GENE.GFUD01089628.1~~GFUD01089628.1.p1  ORF type:complete len:133 (-),score=19.04 GFUD01089628.1:24-422(-)